LWLCATAFCAVGEAVIADLRVLSQDPRSHLAADVMDHPLLPAAEQARFGAVQRILHFAPWQQVAPLHTREESAWGFAKYGKDPGYGRAGKPHPRDWMRKLEANARLEDYPQGGFPAVTLKRVDVRVMPTREPHSSFPRGPSKEHPFDNLQESSLPAGTPLLVTHVSRDGRWMLAETTYALGWIEAASLAKAGPEFRRQWEAGQPLVIVRDRVPVRDEKDRLLFAASLGAFFPEAAVERDRVWIMVAGRDAEGGAVVKRAWLPPDAVANQPLPFTPRRVAQIAAELAGEPYGWGGLDGKRDCSATIRDLFIPFGFWLPRNSGDQARAGRFVSFRYLSPEQKEAQIVRQGVPWRTLLWTPGHIMLYIGLHEGRPLIFHNFWSVRTRDASGKGGRIIVGRAAVTTLHPGRERPDLDLPGADVLYGLGGMTLLAEWPEAIP
jgi:cell wall-associated NlpC family hydrolase